MFNEREKRRIEKDSVIARYTHAMSEVLRAKGIQFQRMVISGRLSPDNICVTFCCLPCKAIGDSIKPVKFCITGTDIICIPPDEMAMRMALAITESKRDKEHRLSSMSFI